MAVALAVALAVANDRQDKGRRQGIGPVDCVQRWSVLLLNRRCLADTLSLTVVRDLLLPLFGSDNSVGCRPHSYDCHTHCCTAHCEHADDTCVSESDCLCTVSCYAVLCYIALRCNRSILQFVHVM